MFQFLVRGGLVANDDLRAGLAVDAGRRELHFRGELLAVRQQAACFQLALLAVAGTVIAQELLERCVILGCNHVQNRGAFNLVQALETEHFQVGAIGKDVHAFMHVGDCVA